MIPHVKETKSPNFTLNPLRAKPVICAKNKDA